MKILKNTFLFLLITLSLTYTCAVQAQSTKTKEIDKVLGLLHKQGKFNGTVLIAEKGNILYKNSFGYESTQANKAISSQSAFNLASVAKQFTAAAIMVLQQKGKLEYNHSLSRYLPQLKHYKQVSIRHLLNHTSGIPDYEGMYAELYGLKAEDKNADYEALFKQQWKHKILTNALLIKLLRKYTPKLKFSPGSKFEYSNTNYILLASIVEKVSQTSFAQFLKKNLFEPAQMHHTYVYHKGMSVHPKNRVYGFKTVKGKPIAHDLMFMDGVTGDGNVYSSTDDLLKWDQALYSEKIITNASKALAFSPPILGNGKPGSYGFGWGIIKPGQKIFHLGQWVGFQSMFERQMDKQRCIILLDNSTSGSNFTATYGIIKAILAGRTYALPQQYTAISLSEQQLQHCVGKYQLRPQLIMAITREGSQLYAQVTNQPKVAIYPSAPHKFFLKVADMQISFIKDTKGKVTQLIMHQQGRKIPAKKVL